jgi:hypothetical protein
MPSILLSEDGLTPVEANAARHAVLTRIQIEISRLEFTLAGLRAERMDAEKEVRVLLSLLCQTIVLMVLLSHSTWCRVS